MHRKLISLAGVFLLLAATRGLAQETEAAQAGAFPAATRSEIDCSGFISEAPVSQDLYVLDGADNDSRVYMHQFGTGDYVYLRSKSGAAYAVGNEYWVLRSAEESFWRGLWRPVDLKPRSLMGNISWYPGQRGSIHSLGKPYEDVGRVKVLSLTPQAAVAEVTFACGPIHPGDIVLPQQARAIPQYTPSAQFDPFAPGTGKLTGAITAGMNNAGFFGTGSLAYVNLGQQDGVTPGQRFRIFRIFREGLSAGWRAFPETPRENLGELVILSTQEKSSVAIVISSRREISLGDGIELQ